MKALTIVLIFFLYSSHNVQREKLLKKFAIGRCAYSIYKESNYSHDDNWNADFFAVYKSGKHKRLCSAYMTAKRNDSTFIKGNYLIYKNRIEFDEYFYYSKNQFSIDSLKIEFYPNKSDDLILKETVEFKNGKATTTVNK